MSTVSSADAYIVSELNKSLASLIETIDYIREEALQIDAEFLAESDKRIGENGEDLLVQCHEFITGLNRNLGTSRLGTLIFSLLCKQSDEV